MEQYSQAAADVAENNFVAEQTNKISLFNREDDKENEEDVSSRASYLEAWEKKKTGEEGILLPEEVQQIGLVV